MTRCPGRSLTPTAALSRSSAVRTSRARLVSGKSLPPASSCRVTPISRKNAIVSPTGNARSTRRIADGLPPQKSRSVTVAFVTLQRDPPLTRIFAPGARAPSSSTTEQERLKRRAKIAVARPAAPAPTIATSHEGGSSECQSRKLNVKPQPIAADMRRAPARRWRGRARSDETRRESTCSRRKRSPRSRHRSYRETGFPATRRTRASGHSARDGCAASASTSGVPGLSGR